MQRLWADLARGLNCSASRTNKYRNGDVFRKRSVASDPVASDVDQRRRCEPRTWVMFKPLSPSSQRLLEFDAMALLGVAW